MVLHRNTLGRDGCVLHPGLVTGWSAPSWCKTWEGGMGGGHKREPGAHELCAPRPSTSSFLHPSGSDDAYHPCEHAPAQTTSPANTLRVPRQGAPHSQASRVRRTQPPATCSGRISSRPPSQLPVAIIVDPSLYSLRPSSHGLHPLSGSLALLSLMRILSLVSGSILIHMISF